MGETIKENTPTIIITWDKEGQVNVDVKGTVKRWMYAHAGVVLTQEAQKLEQIVLARLMEAEEERIFKELEMGVKK